MIIELLLLGSVIAAGVAVKKYWEEIKNWAINAYNKLAPFIKQAVQEAAAYLQKFGQSIRSIANYYWFKPETKTWQETTVTREMNYNDIPDEIREKLSRHNKIELELTNAQ